MKSLQNIAAPFFIMCVAVLAVISIMGVWGLFSTDIVWKAFQTLGLVAIVSILIIVAGRFITTAPTTVVEAQLPHPVFKGMRNVTLGVLIVAAILLAMVGVLAIWEVIADMDLVMRALSSLAILSFASLVIVMVCLEREQNEVWRKQGQHLGGISVLLFIGLVWLLIATFS